MWRQIKQVILTYTTHRGWFWGAILFGVMVLPGLVAAFTGNRAAGQRAQPVTMILGMPMFFLMPFLVGHVKAQFAHPRARLTPHFIPAHLIVLGGLMIFALLVFPLIIALCTGLSWLGLTALAISIAIPMGWGNHRNNFPLTILGLAVFYSLLTTWGMNWWIVDASQHVLAHALIVIIGGLAIAAWMARLSQLREEMDDYQRIFQFRLPRRSGPEESEQRKIVAAQIGRNRLNAWIGDLWNDSLGGYQGHGWFDLVRLRRHGMAIVPMEYQALLIAGFALAIMLFFTQVSFIAKAGVGAFFFPLIMAIMMPGTAGGEMLARRRSLTAAELTLPLTRSEFINGLLLVLGWNSFVFWLAINFVLVLAISSMNDKFTTIQLAMFLILSASITTTMWGISTRISVWNSIIKRLMVYYPATFILAVPMAAWWTQREKIGDWPFIGLAAVLVFVGAAFISSARRAWLNLELG